MKKYRKFLATLGALAIMVSFALPTALAAPAKTDGYRNFSFDLGAESGDYVIFKQSSNLICIWTKEEVTPSQDLVDQYYALATEVAGGNNAQYDAFKLGLADTSIINGTICAKSGVLFFTGDQVAGRLNKSGNLADTFYVTNDGDNWYACASNVSIVVYDKGTTPADDPPKTNDDPECTCELTYSISKGVYTDESCETALTEEISAGTEVWYKVTVTVAIDSSNCKAAEGDHTVTLPETVTIYDPCMKDGFMVANVDENEDGTGTATVTYSYTVTAADFATDGTFENIATVNNETASVKVKEITPSGDKGGADDGDTGGSNKFGGSSSNSGTDVKSFEEVAPTLAAAPEEIFEEAIPLTETPAVEEAPVVEEIEESAPPMSQMPQTGISDSIILMICGLLAASAVLPVVVITLKKVKKNGVTR